MHSYPRCPDCGWGRFLALRVMGLITSTGTRILSTRSSCGQSWGQTARLRLGSGKPKVREPLVSPRCSQTPPSPGLPTHGPRRCCPPLTTVEEAVRLSNPGPGVTTSRPLLSELVRCPLQLLFQCAPDPLVQTPGGPLSAPSSPSRLTLLAGRPVPLWAEDPFASVPGCQELGQRCPSEQLHSDTKPSAEALECESGGGGRTFHKAFGNVLK